MNFLLLILYLTTFSLHVGNNSGGPLTLTFHHGIKLNKIQEPGSKYEFIQLCTTTIDSVISTGNVIMEKAKVGKIKNCNYQMQIREDTLRAIVIETFTEKNIRQVILQATSQFGSPTESKTNLNTIYEWKKKTATSEIKAMLVTDLEQETGVLTVTN